MEASWGIGVINAPNNFAFVGLQSYFFMAFSESRNSTGLAGFNAPTRETDLTRMVFKVVGPFRKQEMARIEDGNQNGGASILACWKGTDGPLCHPFFELKP